MSKMHDRALYSFDAGEMPEDVLVALLKAGETKAYKFFFWEYCDYVNLLAHTLLPSQEDARGVMQEIMREVWLRRKTSWLKAPLKPFLYREVYRKCRPYFTDNKKPTSFFGRLFRL